MRASLLFYRKLRKELEGYGLIWHVDDLMVLFEDDFELTKFLCYLGNIYGTMLSMHMGCKHDYLGVDMEFCEDGVLEVSMFKYLNNVIENFPFPRDHMQKGGNASTR